MLRSLSGSFSVGSLSRLFHWVGPITTVRVGLERRTIASISTSKAFQRSASSLSCGSLSNSNITEDGALR